MTMQSGKHIKILTGIDVRALLEKSKCVALGRAA
jgi:hypothetical protein